MRKDGGLEVETWSLASWGKGARARGRCHPAWAATSRHFSWKEASPRQREEPVLTGRGGGQGGAVRGMQARSPGQPLGRQAERPLCRRLQGSRTPRRPGCRQEGPVLPELHTGPA